MTTTRRRGEPTRETDGGGVFMISNAIKRANAALSGGRVAAFAVAAAASTAAACSPGATTQLTSSGPPTASPGRSGPGHGSSGWARSSSGSSPGVAIAATVTGT